MLGLVSEHDSGDKLACTGSIVMFCSFMLFESKIKHPAAPVCFMMASLMWGFVLQPAVLNRCHLTLWLLLIESFRNLLTANTRATFTWGHATLGNVYRSALNAN